MFNSGFIPTEFDGTEKTYSAPKNMGIPKEFSYKKYLPDVVNQGQDPICVPCSLSAHINYLINLKTGSEKDNKVDLHGIYEKKSTFGDGMHFKDAFNILQNDGVKTKSGIFKIGQPMRILSSLALKFAILTNGPCLGALPCYNASGIDEFWNPKKGKLEGYHAISIIGFNEDGFIIRNSWGKSYGKDGYALLKNEHFDQFIELWTIVK